MPPIPQLRHPDYGQDTRGLFCSVPPPCDGGLAACRRIWCAGRYQHFAAGRRPRHRELRWDASAGARGLRGPHLALRRGAGDALRLSRARGLHQRLRASRQSEGSHPEEATLPCGVLLGTCRLLGPILCGAVAGQRAKALGHNVTAHLHPGAGAACEGAAAAGIELFQPMG